MRTRRGDPEFRIGLFNSVQTLCNFYRHRCGTVNTSCAYPTLCDDCLLTCSGQMQLTPASTMCLYMVQCRLICQTPMKVASQAMHCSIQTNTVEMTNSNSRLGSRQNGISPVYESAGSFPKYNGEFAPAGPLSHPGHDIVDAVYIPYIDVF